MVDRTVDLGYVHGKDEWWKNILNRQARTVSGAQVHNMSSMNN